MIQKTALLSPRPVRGRPTRAQTRERLLNGALEAFAERGFQGATQEDICERVRLSRGAYNSNFRSKEELFFAIYDRTIERLERHLETSIASALSGPGPAVENFVRAFIAGYAFDRSWYLLQAEFGLHALRNPAVASHYAARQARILSVIEEAVCRVWSGIEPGRPHASSRVARLILAVHEGAMFQRLLEPSAIKDGELLALFAEFLVSRSVIDA
ncbi:MAG: TetR/AcrR family transcriptional regulator [Brevundimonas diminuta]|jgi:AcrR family transcriptional regulator|nr:TetR/AcrR family transcriptional regulator [Brevundimonas diminuta]